jgi:D-xylose transport system substrate-binding protein
VPFVKLEPRPIDIDHVKDVVAAGFVTKKDLCTAKFAALCNQYGVGVAPSPSNSTDGN